MDERKRDSIVAYLRRRMAEYGIEPEDVAASIAADQEKVRAARYRDAFGNTWDGKGDAPQWVLQATSAGQSLEHFSIGETTTGQPATPASVDWRKDPFAGTRLATVKSEQSVEPTFFQGVPAGAMDVHAPRHRARQAHHEDSLRERDAKLPAR